MSGEVRNLIEDLQERRVGRRAFIRRALALGLSAGAASALLAACAPAATPTAPPTAPTAPAAAPTAPAAKPAAPTAAPAAASTVAAAPTTAPAPAPTAAAKAAAQGERVVAAVAAWGIETPLPWRLSSSDGTLWNVVFDPLVQRDPNTMALKPGVASSWDHSPDYKTWTFKLRQGIMFHENWGELTSEDVKYTVEQNVKVPDAQGGSVAYFKALLDGIETPDKYTFVIHFKQPTWEVPTQFSPALGYQYPVSKKYLEAVGEQKAALHPITTGPYRHVEGRQGEYHRFEAVPNHWRITPGFKEIIIRRIPDPAARLAGVRAGEIDFCDVYGDYLEQAKKAGLKIFEVPKMSHYWIVLPGQTAPDKPDYNPKLPWTGDINDPKSTENARKVRLAMNLAVNKQPIVDNIWRGYGNLDPFSYYYFPFHKGFSQEWKIPPYDPARAKQLLAEAGYPNGFEIKLNPSVYSIATDGPDITEAVALDWDKVGIKVKRVPEDYGSFLGKTRARNTGDAGFTVAAPGFDEPGVIWPRVIHSKGAFLYVIEGPFDQDVDAISAELDEEKRAKMEGALGQKLYDGYYGTMIGWKTFTYAASKKIATWTPLRYPWENGFETFTWSGQ